MADYSFSVASLEFGEVGTDGAMGTTLTRITPLKEDSVTLTMPEPTTTAITAEDQDTPIVSLEGKSDAPTIEFNVLDLSKETLVKLFGGTVEGEVYSFPSKRTPITGSLKLTGRPLFDKKVVWSFPLVQLSASLDGNMTKNDLTSVKVKGQILTPVGADGMPLPLFTKETVSTKV